MDKTTYNAHMMNHSQDQDLHEYLPFDWPPPADLKKSILWTYIFKQNATSFQVQSWMPKLQAMGGLDTMGKKASK